MTDEPWRPTLRQVFILSLLGLLLGLGLLFYILFRASEQTILHSSERYRKLVSDEVAERIKTYLDEAPMAALHFEQDLRYGLIDPKKRDSVEQALLSLLLANQNISEATLTYADPRSFGPKGPYPPPDPMFSGQVALLRSTRPGEFIRKVTWYDGRQFVATSESIAAETGLVADIKPQPAMDPTTHLTFQTAASPDIYGRMISTDLHWAQIDEVLPEPQRRVEVSVLKAIENGQGRFVGVLRVGLMKAKIDGAVQATLAAAEPGDPHLIFLCDSDGRLITGFGARDLVTVYGDDLRIAAADVPPAVARALQEPVLKTIDSDQRTASSFLFDGRVYLCSYRGLPQTQGWIVGIVVPRDFYLGELLPIRTRVIWASFLLMAALVLGGSLIVRIVVRAQSLILRETARMNRFEFTPSENSSALQDVREVLGGLERAKTAMRAMSKYVPVNLVRQLYHEGQEPRLGGQPAELSVLFTDIRDFTTIAEEIPPGLLAEILGKYLHVMAGVIQQQKGTIDKYIGDSVMAFWNAPEAVPGHEVLACRAALHCREALRQLYASPAWGDAPRFETRFGLHQCQASVGHFGAPDRFNYTAIGDGINLTSRLEGLNKFYGTTTIVSHSVYAAAERHFNFRLLDRVAVKGKTLGIPIYELVGERSLGAPRPEFIERYEQAFVLYQRSEFSFALHLLEQQPTDPPSPRLAQRCRELIAEPPGHWDSVRVFDAK